MEELNPEEPASLVEVLDDVVEAPDRVLDDPLAHGLLVADCREGAVPGTSLWVPPQPRSSDPFPVLAPPTA